MNGRVAVNAGCRDGPALDMVIMRPSTTNHGREQTDTEENEDELMVEREEVRI